MFGFYPTTPSSGHTLLRRRTCSGRRGQAIFGPGGPRFHRPDPSSCGQMKADIGNLRPSSFRRLTGARFFALALLRVAVAPILYSNLSGAALLLFSLAFPFIRGLPALGGSSWGPTLVGSD